MVDSDDAQEMLQRFEREMDLPESAKTIDDVYRKFNMWTDKKPTVRQRRVLENYARKEGISLVSHRRKEVGISKRKGISREKLKRKYVAHIYHTKKGIVRRVIAHDIKTGRIIKKGS